MRSRGSTPVPRLLLIRRPSGARIVGCIITSSKGISPAYSKPIIIILDTHRKIISLAVESTEVGQKESSSFVSLGHPKVTKGQRAELNQVSRTSSSCLSSPPQSGHKSGASSVTTTPSHDSQYQTGRRCPHHSWRLRHHGRIFRIQSRYTSVHRSGTKRSLTSLIHAHSLELARLLIHTTIIPHHGPHLQPVTPADIPVIGIVPGRDFQSPCPKLRVHMFVGNDRHFASYKGNHHLGPHIPTKALIPGIHCHRRISQNSLRTRGGYSEMSIASNQRIVHIVERVRGIRVLNFKIR